MEWRDEGIVLGTRKHGETSVILEMMTACHGRHLGIVRGGRSRRMQPLLQAGNRLELVWRARLDEHLGTFQVEPLEQNAARLMGSAVAIYGIQVLGAHLRLLPERDPHGGLYAALVVITSHLDDAARAGVLLPRFELAVLEELGFGLDFSCCALTGAREGLAYVSPKTGRAVTAAAGKTWAERLLPLPVFLSGGGALLTNSADVANAFRLSGHFLARNVYGPRGLSAPEARAGLINALMRALQ